MNTPSNPKNDPQKTIAVVVGIEKYEVAPNWSLNGPANDAIHFIEWLQRQGLPTGNIHLFLSPLAEAFSLPAQVQNQQTSAEESAIFKFLTNKLPNLAEQTQCNTLFFFWAGHGVVTGDQRHRLFCSDATESSKLSIDFNSFLQMARSTLYAKLPRQIFIIDACANYFESMRTKATLPDRSFPHGEPLGAIEQEVLFAAAAGQLTKNDNLRNTGEFSDFLLAQLKQSTPEQWPPDLVALLEAARQFSKQKAFYLRRQIGGQDTDEGKLPQPGGGATKHDQTTHGDQINAQGSQGFVNRPTGPVTQNFGPVSYGSDPRQRDS